MPQPRSGLVKILDVELNALANGAWANGTHVFNNANAQAGDVGGALMYADFEAFVAFQVGNPTAATTLDLFAIPSYDGSHYADGSDTVVPQDALKLAAFVLRAATPQRLVVLAARLPVAPAMRFVLH